MRKAWPRVALRRLDAPRRNIVFGDSLRFEVAVNLNGLDHDDVVVEMILGRHAKKDNISESMRYQFEFEGAKSEAAEHLFALQLTPELCGRLEYRIRVYPCHELLTHPLEMGMMLWL